ncbi:MAG: hypothetical protein J3R72DRAFT_92394 [Linnemannia gamsii]|nr:MAG: hypothetical protein J3R72DRAFT_92394 [Linnemannia gamsii]
MMKTRLDPHSLELQWFALKDIYIKHWVESIIPSHPHCCFFILHPPTRGGHLFLILIVLAHILTIQHTTHSHYIIIIIIPFPSLLIPFVQYLTHTTTPVAKILLLPVDPFSLTGSFAISAILLLFSSHLPCHTSDRQASNFSFFSFVHTYSLFILSKENIVNSKIINNKQQSKRFSRTYLQSKRNTELPPVSPLLFSLVNRPCFAQDPSHVHHPCPLPIRQHPSQQPDLNKHLLSFVLCSSLLFFFTSPFPPLFSLLFSSSSLSLSLLSSSLPFPFTSSIHPPLPLLSPFPSTFLLERTFTLNPLYPINILLTLPILPTTFTFHSLQNSKFSHNGHPEEQSRHGFVHGLHSARCSLHGTSPPSQS